MKRKHRPMWGYVLPVLVGFGLACAPEANWDGEAGNVGLAPEESPFPEGYYDVPTPPPGFTATIGWMQAVHGARGKPTTTEWSQVEVDWMKLWVRVDGEDILLALDAYEMADPEWRWFGLYLRNPWFGGDQHSQLPVEHNAVVGSLIVTPSDWPNRVGHWWNTQYPRPEVPSNADRVWLECRVRVTGQARVQAGIDHWRSPTATYAGWNVNNREAGVSDWYGAAAGWQILSVGRP